MVSRRVIIQTRPVRKLAAMAQGMGRPATASADLVSSIMWATESYPISGQLAAAKPTSTTYALLLILDDGADCRLRETRSLHCEQRTEQPQSDMAGMPPE